MLKEISRARVIQIWFAAVAAVAVCGMAFGASVTASTAAVLLALCLTPPAIVLLLWPRVETPTVAEVLRGVDQRV